MTTLNAQEKRLNDLYASEKYDEINRWIAAKGQVFIANSEKTEHWQEIFARHDLCPAGAFDCLSVAEAVRDAVRSAANGCRAYAYDGRRLVATIEPFTIGETDR